VVGLVGGEDGRVGSEREMNPGEGNQVGLELVQVDVEGSVESKRSGDGRDDLSDQPVQVVVGRRLDAEVSSADLVDTGRRKEKRNGQLEPRGGKRDGDGTHASLSTMNEQSECSRVV